jgi:dTDP-4-dehydrorhamnose reductase
MGSDEVVSPTYTHYLSEAVLQLIEHPKTTPVIYHLLNEGRCSWYELTKTIYEIMGFTVQVNPLDRGRGSGEKRPLCSAFANTKAWALGTYYRPGEMP